MKHLLFLLGFCSLASAVDLEWVELESRRTFVVRAQTAGNPTAVGEALAQIFPRVSAYLAAEGIESKDAPFARFFDYTPGVSALFEAGYVSSESLEGEAEIYPSRLPGGFTIRALHLGPYETLDETYQAIQEEMSAQSYEPRDVPWEVYQQAETEPYETWVYFPVQARIVED